MSEVSSFSPGTFCWVDLGTTDADGAKKFYGELFGWEADDMPAEEIETYTVFKKNGKSAAGMYQLTPEMISQGFPPFWMSHLAVASTDETTTKTKELGGTVIDEPKDMGDVGRMAVIQDPTGAVVGLWEPKAERGLSIANEPGSICWNELVSRDSNAAGTFYTTLLDWGSQEQEISDGEKYTTFMNGEKMAGGMMQMTSDWPEHVPSHWMPYFAVEDCDTSTDKAKELGAHIIYGPSDIPGVGRFSLISDPQGAAFSIIKLEMPAQS